MNPALEAQARALVHRLRQLNDEIMVCSVCGFDYGSDGAPVHVDCEFAALELAFGA